MERAAELLYESNAASATAIAANGVRFRDEKAASSVADWNALFCRGYKVEELDIEQIGTSVLRPANIES